MKIKIVDEYDLKLDSFTRKITLPDGSGAVSSVQLMNNSQHLLIASEDNIRLWNLEHDLQEQTKPESLKVDKEEFNQNDFFADFGRDPFEMDIFSSLPNNVKSKKPSTEQILDLEFLSPAIPFTIVPGHHGGSTSMMSNLYID